MGCHKSAAGNAFSENGRGPLAPPGLLGVQHLLRGFVAAILHPCTLLPGNTHSHVPRGPDEAAAADPQQQVAVGTVQGPRVLQQHEAPLVSVRRPRARAGRRSVAACAARCDRRHPSLRGAAMCPAHRAFPRVGAVERRVPPLRHGCECVCPLPRSRAAPAVRVV